MYTLNTCLLSAKHFMWMTIIYNECMISHKLIFFVFTLVEGVCQTAHLSSMIQVDISVRGRQWMSILVWRSALWTAPELSLDPTTEMNSTCTYMYILVCTEDYTANKGLGSYTTWQGHSLHTIYSKTWL